MNGPKVAVLGDIMLDRYFEADVKQSPEHDGECIVNPKLIRQVPGGAGNVATCLANMGIPTVILGPNGSNIVKEIFSHTKNLLDKTFVVPGTLCQKDRYLHKGKTLTRIDIDPNSIMDYTLDIPDSCEVLITSDYNKGNISEPILKELKGKFRTWIADPKKIFFDAYKTEEIIVKPNSVEALDLTSTNNTLDAITKLAEWTPGRVVVTNGSDPIHFEDRSGMPLGYMGISPHRPKTVIGAGDVMTAVLAAGAIEGWELRKSLEAAILACIKMMSQVPGNTIDKESWNHIVTEVTKN